jgi:hypothetical protein
MTQTVEADARSHPAIELAFGLPIVSGPDSPHQVCIAQRENHRRIFYV